MHFSFEFMSALKTFPHYEGLYMLFSVISINLNNKNGLYKTLNSVKSQTFQDYELIIVDGGSTDGSLSVLDDYKDIIDLVIHQEDRGIYNAMNLGILKANGDFILFLNSGDTFYHSSTLERVSLYCKNKHFLYFGRAKMSVKEHMFWMVPDEKYENKISSWLRHNLPIHQSIFFPTEFCYDNLYDERFVIAGDLEYKLRAQKLLPPFVFINGEAICICSIGGLSTSYSSLKTVCKKIHETYLAIYKYYDNSLEVVLKISLIMFVQISKFLLNFLLGEEALYFILVRLRLLTSQDWERRK